MRLFKNMMAGLFMLMIGYAVHAGEIDLVTYPAWQLVNVEVEHAEHHGEKALRVKAKQPSRQGDGETLAILADTDFTNGTIELEVAGKPSSSAGQMARGFIGVAFRVQKNAPENYEAFYLRPTNARAEDQLRRNHTVQYISHPQHTWMSLRKAFPGKYESYTDLVPGEWTKVKIVVNGTDARLFVAGANQPCLIVKDLKHGEGNGAVALWIHPSTEAYFRNLSVTDQTSLPLSPDAIVGSWQYVSGIKDGEKLDAEHFGDQSVEITKDTITLFSRTQEGEATFVLKYKLDQSVPAKVALEITASPFGAGAQTEGIIGLQKGNLRICYPPGGGAAPKEFTAERGSGHFLFELKRK